MTDLFRKLGKSGKSRRFLGLNLDFSFVQIKCSFCGNAFYARPSEAICPKCERPANRDLEPRWRILSLLLPPLGFGYALWIRPHSPIAAFQAFKRSLIGSLVLCAPVLIKTLF